MSSSRRSRKPHRSVDDGDPGISRSRTADVGASTKSTARTQGDSTGDDDDSGELFVGWEHRMNTDERRRMRQEEEKQDSASASKRLSGSSASRAADPRAGRSTTAYAKYNRSSASKEIRVGGHSSSGPSSSRSTEMRRRNDPGEDGRTILSGASTTSRDRSARYDDPEQRSTLARAMEYDASSSRSKSSKSKKSPGDGDSRSQADPRRKSWGAAQNEPPVPSSRALSSDKMPSRKSSDVGSRTAARNRLAERMLADGDVSKSRSRLAEKLGLMEDDSVSRGDRYRGSTSRSIVSMKSSSASIASIRNSSSRPPIPRDIMEETSSRTSSSISVRSSRKDDTGISSNSDRSRPSGSRRKRHEQSDIPTSIAEVSHLEMGEKIDRSVEKSRKSEKARSSRDKARKAEKMKTSTPLRIPENTPPKTDFQSAIGDPSEDSEPAAISTDEDQSEEEVSEAEEPSSGDDEKQKWSVRVSIISAVDMPNSLVPSTPLCPVLKLGLVAMPTENEGNEEDETVIGANARRSVLKNIETSGLTSIPKSRVRCTSTKILSKRDHGAVEFHEDMRWDNVKRPHTSALAVELCARAVMPPTNAHESPLPKLEAALEPQVTAPLLSASTPQQLNTYPADMADVGSTASPTDIRRERSELSEQHSKSMADDTKSQGFLWGKKPEKKEEEPPPSQEVGGIAGMRALWNKGRQQLEAQRQQGKRKSAQGSATGKEGELDTANAAAAVARFLIGGPPTGGEGEKDSIEHQGVPDNANGKGSEKTEDEAVPLPDSQLQSRAAMAPVGQDVALTIKRRKKRKTEMTEDVRLGAVVVPLTRLPLGKATEGREAARIETWFPLDTSSNMQLGDGPMRVDRRVPRVLLEISFSSPDILDESEDEMDEPDEEEASFAEDLSPSDPEGKPGVQWDADVETKKGLDETNKSFARRSSMNSKKEGKATLVPKAEPTPVPETEKQEDPTLNAGVVDYVAVVGCRDIGDQKLDDGSKGWVNSTPECTMLEAFPPNHEFHESHGRSCLLPDKIEWFCFPEGTKLWRGTQPPSHSDLNLKRFSGASPPNVASSIAAFDACLNCTTSFSWFVLSSTSEDYGSKNKKTYGAVIRFYAPAPTGIDPKADDYAQLIMGGPRDVNDSRRKNTAGSAKRLWVPMGICIVTEMPIVGIMEAILLRICEALAARTGSTLYSSIPQKVFNIVQQDVANLIINYQRPIPGVLHCSIPFLQGERLHLTLPPPTGLPPLPHGGSVTSVCRLLSAEGLNILLAAVLTECKIVIHSDDVANLAMVAEVITALIYPFDWALPYIPVLPEAMLEFIEAPLSYFLGIPTCSMKIIDPTVLNDVVVIDLDNGFSSQDYLDGRRGNRTTKVPTPLPSSVANNISKAVFRLLREEDDIEVEYGSSAYPASRSLPRLESESLAEREFRISVALQVCSLVRGYQDCLFFVSASQPVFNRDRFLRNAPALFEDRRGNPVFSDSSGSVGSQRMLSPRSKRFLSLLVNTQQFHGLLEVLEHEDVAFFHEVMDTFDSSEDQRDEQVSNLLSGYGSSKLEESASHLSQALQKVEDKIPTYRVDRKGKHKKNDGVFADEDDDDDGLEEFLDGDENIHDISFSDDTLISSFTTDLLRPIVDGDRNNTDFGEDDEMSLESSQSEGVHSLSVKYLLMLEKNPWRYRKLFDIPLSEDEKPSKRSTSSVVVEVREKVKLKDAIGERRYRAWKLLQEQKVLSTEDSQTMPENSSPENDVDFKTMLSSVMTDDMTSETSSVTTAPSLDFSSESRKAPSVLSPEQQRVADAKDRDVLRRCLERAYDGTNRRNSRMTRGPAGGSVNDADAFVENGRDLIADAETALRNPSAQRFLVSVLSQRSRMENKKKNRFGKEDQKGRHRQANQSSVSRLQHPAFECLVRLCCAMLDACMEAKDYEPAYRLLTQTAGFCTVGDEKQSAIPAREQEDNDHNSKLIYMTARIGLHPIFADLRLWEKVLSLHLQNRQNDKSVGAHGSSSGRSTPSDGRSDKAALEGGPSDEYEAAVATLYEMLGYGIPAEELARFATRVSEENGWFSSERGHSLLMLARRLSVRRDVEDGASGAGNLDLMTGGGKSNSEGMQTLGVGIIEESNGKMEWLEIGWSHPATTNIRPPVTMNDSNKAKSRAGSGPGASAKYSLLEGTEDDETQISNVSQNSKNGSDDTKYLKRTPITSLASFGSSVVASGGLDGSVFLAHTIQFPDEKNKKGSVRGVRLEWGTSSGRLGSSTPSMDGEYGVGAVSCLAAAQGPGFRHGNAPDLSEQADEDEVMAAMEGCRVIAGTTGGDLRVWSVKEVYAATALASGQSDSGGVENVSASLGDLRIQHSGGADSASVSGSRRRNTRGSITQIAAGSASSRLKFSLRGWALSGHRGGVSCVDVPSHIYRPDALVTGGADGLIKLWSLVRRTGGDGATPAARLKFHRSSIVGSSGVELSQTRGKGGSGSDALSILTGHGGRVLCVKAAWHGDGLISGGVDRTVRIWDLSGSSGKCVNALSGHLGWVTQAHYWGPHTIVSASTDRAIALWDARARNAPLFVLRHHHAPVSDLLVGSRTDPLMVSAACDGTVATWDFRTLSSDDTNVENIDGKKPSKVIRQPLATMQHSAEGKGVKCSGTVLLSRGTSVPKKSVISVGADAVVKEWDVATGKSLSKEHTGHCDVISSLTAFTDGQNAAMGSTDDGTPSFGGTITSSWDGTVRMRSLVRKKL